MIKSGPFTGLCRHHVLLEIYSVVAASSASSGGGGGGGGGGGC